MSIRIICEGSQHTVTIWEVFLRPNRIKLADDGETRVGKSKSGSLVLNKETLIFNRLIVKSICADASETFGEGVEGVKGSGDLIRRLVCTQIIKRQIFVEIHIDTINIRSN